VKRPVKRDLVKLHDTEANELLARNGSLDFQDWTIKLDGETDKGNILARDGAGRKGFDKGYVIYP
jgi:hypothetical protein